LLVSSAKNTFDAQRKQVNELAAEIATLQRILALYGDETAAAREGVRATVSAGIERAWSAHGEKPTKLTLQEHGGNALFYAIQQLQPKNAMQSDLKSRATSLTLEIVEGRALLVAQAAGGLSMSLLGVILCWFVLILFGFSLLAPRNTVATLALILAAGAVCGAIFLMTELYGQFDGLIQVSSEPLRSAIGN